MSEAFEIQLAETSTARAGGPGFLHRSRGRGPCGDLVRVSLTLEAGAGGRGQPRHRGLRRDKGGDQRRGRADRGRTRARGGGDRGGATWTLPSAASARQSFTPPGSPPTLFTAPSRPPRARRLRSRRPVLGRVLVAVSGGVDSAVAALLERERGAEVVAVTREALGRPRDRRGPGLLLARGGAGCPRRSPTRSGCRTSPSTSRTSSATAWWVSSSPGMPPGRPPTPACSATAR